MAEWPAHSPGDYKRGTFLVLRHNFIISVRPRKRHSLGRVEAGEIHERLAIVNQIFVFLTAWGIREDTPDKGPHFLVFSDYQLAFE